MRLGILAVWAKLEEMGFYVSYRAGCYFLRAPDGRQCDKDENREALFNRLPRQFA